MRGLSDKYLTLPNMAKVPKVVKFEYRFLMLIIVILIEWVRTILKTYLDMKKQLLTIDNLTHQKSKRATEQFSFKD